MWAWSNLCACLCSLRLALVGRSCLLSQKYGKEADFITLHFHWMLLKFCPRSTIFFSPRKEAIYFGFICVIYCLELGASNDAKALASVPALTSMGWLLACNPNLHHESVRLCHIQQTNSDTLTIRRGNLCAFVLDYPHSCPRIAAAMHFATWPYNSEN